MTSLNGRVAAVIGARVFAPVIATFRAIDSQAGQIDILVNSAGIQRVGLIGKISFADFSTVATTHLNGFFLCASEAVPRMVKHAAGGAIISIPSTAAIAGLPRRGLHCAAKASILGLTRGRWRLRSRPPGSAPMRRRPTSLGPN